MGSQQARGPFVSSVEVGFCLLLAAICWRVPFVLPLHARFGHRSQITGNTVITDTLLLVSSAATVCAWENGGSLY